MTKKTENKKKIELDDDLFLAGKHWRLWKKGTLSFRNAMSQRESELIEILKKKSFFSLSYAFVEFIELIDNFFNFSQRNSHYR